MKCQHCKTQEATLHHSSNINGRISEIHLCGACAARLGYDKTLFDFGTSFFSPFAHTFFAPALFFDGVAASVPVQKSTSTAIREPVQKIDFDLGEDVKRRRRLNELHAKLKHAIAEEQYEKAAELRDSIHRLQSQ